MDEVYHANGNVSEYLDNNGAVMAHYEYSPFGRTTAATGAKSADFNHRFSTKFFDSETELYYYGYRYYNPSLGRWINRDPIDENGGLNLYVVCLNDMLNRTDRLGRKSSKCDDSAEKLEKLIEAAKVIKDAKDEFESYAELGENAALILEAIDGNVEAQAALAEKGLDKVISELASKIGLPAGSAAVLKEALALGNKIGTWIGDECLKIDCAGACNSCTLESPDSTEKYETEHFRSGRKVSCLYSKDCKIYAKCLVRTGEGGVIRSIIDWIKGTDYTWRWVKCD